MQHVCSLALVGLTLVAVFSATTPSAAEPWSFVSIPDFLNNDVDASGNSGRWTGNRGDGSIGALDYVLDAIAAENPDFVLVAGDLVMGRWSLDQFSDVDITESLVPQNGAFAHISEGGLPGRIQHIWHMANIYYPAWKTFFSSRSLSVYTAVGDHEMGDNDWDRPWDPVLIPEYRAAYRTLIGMPTNGPAGFEGRAFSVQHKNLQMVVVDVFETDGTGNMAIGVTGDQLDWVDQTLASSTAMLKVVVGHTPILPGWSARSSSCLALPGRADSDLWRTMAENGTDLYLCGEMHDVSMQQRDGVLQIVHGSQPSSVAEINYLVVTVHDDGTTELEIKMIETTRAGQGGVSLDPYRADPYVQRVVKVTPAQWAAGFQSMGRMALSETPAGKNTFNNQTGVFVDRYDLQDESTACGDMIAGITVRGSVLDYTVLPRGFGEDALAYADRSYDWNGVTAEDPIPDYLVGADYICTANDDKVNRGLEIVVSLARPGWLYVLHDDHLSVPDWMSQLGFIDTDNDVGLDNPGTAVGPGNGVVKIFSVFALGVPVPADITLLHNGSDSGSGNYGIVAAPTSLTITAMRCTGGSIRIDVEGLMIGSSCTLYRDLALPMSPAKEVVDAVMDAHETAATFADLCPPDGTCFYQVAEHR